MEYMNEKGETKQLKIIKSISRKWETLATLLGIEEDPIRKKFMGEAEGCTRQVLNDWMDQGASGYPVTWRGLVKVLKDIPLRGVVKEVEAALECMILD